MAVKQMLDVNQIYCGDCLDIMRDMPDKCVDLVLTDPPYYRVMTQDYAGNKYEWDNSWESFEEYLTFIDECFIEFKRILKNNGSLYCFADDKIAAYIQVIGDKYFHLENNIVWFKPNNMPIKGWSDFRSYAPATERILFYSCEVEKTGLQEIYEDKSCFADIKQYMRAERDKIIEACGFKTLEAFNDYINAVSETSSVVSRHYFADSQWVFPTRDIYKKLQTTGFFQREYEELRQEYEELRRPFAPKENYTDVWEMPITSGKERLGHPTQKPIKLIERIINTSSRDGMIVFDPFLGSGTTAHACINTGRRFIGIEKDPDYFKIAQDRINKAKNQDRLESWF
ncbi:MAG: site-specific DNA-methyltransferase [Candidatus Methanomethylophilus sp.]|nr:site-specific DNA-methyltransferase [Methanomethylophilus sp.]